MNPISRDEALRRICQTNGRAFSATFTKRTDHTLRTMRCRIGVSKGVKGVGMAYDPITRGLIVVWDFDRENFRMIPIDGLLSLTVDGQTYQVQQELEIGMS